MNEHEHDTLLAYTYHPLIDIGIAALTVLAQHTDPSDLTWADLESAAAFLAKCYTDDDSPMRNFARGTIFHNAGYTSSSVQAKQRLYIARVLESWRPGTPVMPGEFCLFCGKPAVYRATRQEVPLLNGADVFNFSPAGHAGVPICGLCSLAVQAMPLGCVKSGGNLIAAHSDDPALTFRLAKAAVTRTRKALTLNTGEGLPGYPYERTRFVEMLVDWLAATERYSRAVEWQPSLTGYFFTNAGQNPSIKIYRLSSAVISFLEAAYHHPDGTLTAAWQRAVSNAWVKPKQGASDHAVQSNGLYEALLNLPDEARRFLRKHLRPTHHWGLVALFLERVMDMEPERIALLRALGERFAVYARDKRAFFYQFSRADDHSKWRRLVLRAADDFARQTGHPLITFDEFTQAFVPVPGAINDWRLARDLITLVMIEQRDPAGEPLYPEIEPESETIADDGEE